MSGNQIPDRREILHKLLDDADENLKHDRWTEEQWQKIHDHVEKELQLLNKGKDGLPISHHLLGALLLCLSIFAFIMFTPVGSLFSDW